VTDADGSHRARTGLAWRRTVLAAAVVAVLTARLALAEGVPVPPPMVIALVATGWLVVLGTTTVRLRTLGQADSRVVRRSVPVVTIATLGYVVLGLVLAALTMW